MNPGREGGGGEKIPDFEERKKFYEENAIFNVLFDLRLTIPLLPTIYNLYQKFYNFW